MFRLLQVGQLYSVETAGRRSAGWTSTKPYLAVYELKDAFAMRTEGAESKMSHENQVESKTSLAIVLH